MKTNRPALAVMALLLAIWIAGCSSEESAADNGDTSRDSVVIEMTAADSTTVLALLQQHHDVDVKEGSMGSFVMAIDSLRGGNDVYWLYKVNGEMVPKAADKTTVGPGDKVSWHFHKMR
jgi:hypothetical protein